MTGNDARIEEIHAHLQATATLPVETRASQWLGEAEAIAADARHCEGAALEKRVGQLQHLLSNVGDVEHEEARAHVEAAREATETLASELGVTDSS
ncbi:hypothetical protein [Natronomonas sp. EA1]|uniref:hypothetical protein n=1 Tax=Natronomonas sp. EA1 TaxID=3421655 RepID=UPI003EB93A8A